MPKGRGRFLWMVYNNRWSFNVAFQLAQPSHMVLHTSDNAASKHSQDLASPDWQVRTAALHDPPVSTVSPSWEGVSSIWLVLVLPMDLANAIPTGWQFTYLCFCQVHGLSNVHRIWVGPWACFPSYLQDCLDSPPQPCPMWTCTGGSSWTVNKL